MMKDTEKENLKYYLYEICIDNPKSSLHGKYYYGMHITDNMDDGYMGSGKIIRSYINKHGVVGLRKTIIKYYDCQEALYEGERQLVDEKRKTLKNNCINISEGGHGGFRYYDDQDNLKPLNFYMTPEDRKRCALAGGQGNKKRLQNEAIRKEYIEKCKYRHEHMDADYKKHLYDSVSRSLKKYYENPENKDVIDEKNRKNKESNKITSNKWRQEFDRLFEHRPEYYRSYGKMKCAMEIFEQRNNLSVDELTHQINDLNEYCKNNVRVEISDELRKKYSDRAKEYHKNCRNEKSKYIYVINGITFENQYDAIQYINENISIDYGCKLSNRVMNRIELGLPCSSSCKTSVKKLYDHLSKVLSINKKE